jgi:hypothetical protein
MHEENGTMHESSADSVDLNRARYALAIREAQATRLLADPIAFSQTMGNELIEGSMEDLLINENPKQIGKLRDEFDRLMDEALERRDTDATLDIYHHYSDFLTYALNEARHYGYAMGAIVEQLRIGLIGVVELRNRGMTFGDTQTYSALQRLRQKHGLALTTVEEEPKAEPATDDVA